ncbi:hypothetical protein BGZ65_000476 [Modicella reniformis]|uniref:Uncharacterized protein n=1 Tax=Modicella reniformis TaxID=1440133 RepID=A0A9P6IMH2_9FUNG|nr:hypothetical protein BGZ65_000476 [Modicella reniformis]
MSVCPSGLRPVEEGRAVEGEVVDGEDARGGGNEGEYEDWDGDEGGVDSNTEKEDENEGEKESESESEEEERRVGEDESSVREDKGIRSAENGKVGFVDEDDVDDTEPRAKPEIDLEGAAGIKGDDGAGTMIGRAMAVYVCDCTDLEWLSLNGVAKKSSRGL